MAKLKNGYIVFDGEKTESIYFKNEKIKYMDVDAFQQRTIGLKSYISFHIKGGNTFVSWIYKTEKESLEDLKKIRKLFFVETT